MTDTVSLAPAEAVTTYAKTAWSLINRSATFGWKLFVGAIEHSPKIAAAALLGLGVLLYFGRVELPKSKPDAVLETQVNGLRITVEGIIKASASKADVAELNARMVVIEARSKASPLTTGSVTKPLKK